MLGFQHADLNFQPEFHHEDVHQGHHHDLATTAGSANINPGGWPSCAQQGQPTAPVTSTTGKKSDKGGKKNSNDAVNNATKKKKTR